jgi:hypothetical protein
MNQLHERYAGEEVVTMVQRERNLLPGGLVAMVIRQAMVTKESERWLQRPDPLRESSRHTIETKCTPSILCLA